MKSNMKALVYEGPQMMMMRELPLPEIGDEEVLIKVAVAGICGSELSGYLGHNSLRKPPLVMGHEFSGTIATDGGAFKKGERVTVNPLISCGQCERCVEGNPHLCGSRKLLGAHRPGAYAEYVAVPISNLFKLPDHVSFTEGAFAEPFACAIHACRLLQLKTSDKLLIVGAGPIGLFLLQVALGCGLTQIAVLDLNEERLQIARELGATTAKQLDQLEAAYMNETGIGIFDASVDAVGMTGTRTVCMDAVRLGGRVIFTGLHAANSELPVNLMIRNELTIMGAFAYSPDDFATAMRWIEEGRVNMLPWTETASLEDGAASFEKLINNPGKTAKIVLNISTSM